jgi:PAS domain S-box-containing protein
VTESRAVRILYMEGDSSLAHLVKERLERTGYTVDVAHDGAEGLSLYGRAAYDLVVVDQSLPVIDGLQIVRHLAADGSPPATVMVTGSGSAAVAIQAIKLGASDYVAKDTKEGYLELLPAVIERILSQLQMTRDRERALAALRASETRYRALVEQIPAIIYTTSFGESSKTFYFSPQVERVLGYSREEWMKGSQRWLRQLHPEDRMRVLAELARSHDSGAPFRAEYRLLSQDGRVLWFHDEAVVIRDEQGDPLFLQGLMFDITERRCAEVELERRAAQLALLNSASRTVVSSLDLETVMETTMRQAIEVLQIEAGSVLSLDPETDELVFEAASGGGAAGLGGRRLPPGHGIAGWVAEHGEPLIISDVHQDRRFYPEVDAASGWETQSILCVPLVYRGRIIGVMQALNKIGREFREEDQQLLEALASTAAIAIENARLYEKVQRELRERMKIEEELREERASLAERVAARTAELSAANAELARAVRLKDEFLASVSHELRTPLNAILGLSEALQEQVYGSLNERQLRSLYNIENSGRHLLSLINDILDVSKIEAGKLELDIGPVAVSSVCQASVGLIKQLVLKKRLKLSLEFDPALRQIQADGRRLKQVLVNLLSNAVKFTPEGGEIGLRVTGDAEQEVVHFTVWDTGIGISQDGMARLFQPFVQLDSSLSRQYAGTGLGLALVRRLTELHGGGVSVESHVGEGSQFTVSLPWRELSQGDQAPAGALHSSPELSASASAEDILSADILSGVHPLILLAEDNETNIATLSDYLLSKGCQVVVARNGFEVIDRTKEEKPDVILMDIQMPEMDGLEAMRRLRTDAAFDVPIIVLTALAMPGDRVRCLEAGASAYLSKPVSLKRLMQAIGEQLGRKEMVVGGTNGA